LLPLCFKSLHEPERAHPVHLHNHCSAGLPVAALQENLKLSPAMLSRFDVIFVLLDRPDELMDQALSEHIMALHSGEHVVTLSYNRLGLE
jgi:hypothetical protein